MKILSEKEIDKILCNVEGTLSISGLQVSDFSKEIGRLYLKGEITSEQAIQRIKDNVLKKNELISE